MSGAHQFCTSCERYDHALTEPGLCRDCEKAVLARTREIRDALREDQRLIGDGAEHGLFKNGVLDGYTRALCLFEKGGRFDCGEEG